MRGRNPGSSGSTVACHPLLGTLPAFDGVVGAQRARVRPAGDRSEIVFVLGSERLQGGPKCGAGDERGVAPFLQFLGAAEYGVAMRPGRAAPLASAALLAAEFAKAMAV